VVKSNLQSIRTPEKKENYIKRIEELPHEPDPEIEQISVDIERGRFQIAS